jgi:hypothetical protein
MLLDVANRLLCPPLLPPCWTFATSQYFPILDDKPSLVLVVVVAWRRQGGKNKKALWCRLEKTGRRLV